MAGPDGAPPGAPESGRARDAASELRSVLDFMLDERLMAQQKEAIAAAETDPQALERYRALEARRIELRRRLRTSSQSA